MLKIFHHWGVPLLAAAIWWGMLIALIACWAGQGHPTYGWMEPTQQRIMYISDVAASNLQPIFISCAGASGLLVAISLASEIYLRTTRRLRPGLELRLGVKISMWLALAFLVIGELGILFVSIFNTRAFPDAHTAMLVIFIVFVGLSSLSSLAEYIVLDKDYPRKRHVLVSIIYRTIWFIIELALAIAFATSRHRSKNAAAVCEWVLAFIYPFYMLLMAWDLWPAYNKSRGHYPDQNGNYPMAPEAGVADAVTGDQAYNAPGPYAQQDPYGQGQYAQGQGQYAQGQGQYAQGQYGQEQYAQGQYGQGQYGNQGQYANFSPPSHEEAEKFHTPSV